jgi:hypothetical protein
MTANYRQRGPDSGEFTSVPAALPVQPGQAGLSPPAAPARAARRASRVVPVIAMPLADAVALAAAVGLAGRVSLASAVYPLAVLVILAATGLHRLRICLRVADQAGRILAAVALPMLVLLPWLPAGIALREALWSAGLVLTLRIVVSAALRAAHRRGQLTEPALVVGAGTFGAHPASGRVFWYGGPQGFGQHRQEGEGCSAPQQASSVQ